MTFHGGSCPRRGEALRKTSNIRLAFLLVAFGFFAALPLRASAASEDELVSLAKSSRKAVIADFGMGLCQQCKKQTATLEKIRKTYGEKVIIRMVNVGKDIDLTNRYEVKWIPTLVFIDSKGKIVLKKVGPLGYEEIRRQLTRMGVE